MKILYFVLLAIFWGGSFIAIKISLEAFSPFFAASARIVIAIVATLIYVIWKKIPFPDKSSTIQMILNGMIGVGIPWSLLFWGEQYVEPALCSILIAAVPVFTVICGAIFIKSAEDKMTWNKWAGVIIGFAGIIVIFQPFISADSVQKIEALFAVMGMTIFYAISITWLKKLSKNVENIMALLLSCIGALIVTAPLAIIYGIMNYTFTGASLLLPSIAILYLALFSTSLGFILFYKLLTEVGTVQASAVGYLIPIVAIVLDLLILKNWIGNHALLGGLIIFAALRLINKPVEKVI